MARPHPQLDTDLSPARLTRAGEMREKRGKASKSVENAAFCRSASFSEREASFYLRYASFRSREASFYLCEAA